MDNGERRRHEGLVNAVVGTTIARAKSPATDSGFGYWTSFYIVVLLRIPGEKISYESYEYGSIGLNVSHYNKHRDFAWGKIFKSWISPKSIPSFGLFVTEDVVVACSSDVPELDEWFSQNIATQLFAQH